MPCILLTNHYDKKALSILHNILPAGFTLESLSEVSKEELIAKAVLADYFLVSGRLRIDKDVLATAKNLKMIQRMGVGLDTLDLKEIDRRGIPLYVNQGINARSVAEHTIMLMLASLRRLTIVDREMKKVYWRRQSQGLSNFELYGKTVGLIGLGNIGSLVASMLKPFGAEVKYFKPIRCSPDLEERLAMTYTPFEELIKQVDILSLHCPLTAQTAGLIGENQLASMKRGAIIINTARGALIDETALINALKAGHIAFAGLDVFSAEPLPKSSPFLGIDNVILTPHISGVTYDSFLAMVREGINNIVLFDLGKFSLIENKRFKIRAY